MNALELRRRTLSKGVYKKTVEGNPAIAQGSLARMYPGITMQGWTEQAQYEGNQLIDTSLVVETDLVKKSFGKITPKTSAVYMNTIYSDGTTKIASLEPGDYYFYFFSERSFNSPYLEYTENGETKTVNMNTSFSVSSPASVTSIKCGGIDVSTEVTYEAQINIGTSALAYEPVYTDGAPSPSPDYPQEIVSAGEYDEGSGKYQYTIKISDSEESPTKSQTVTLTSDRPLTKWDRLEKRNGQWGWVYKSAEIVLDGSERWYTNNTLGGYIVYCINTGLENGEFYISNFQESRQPNAMMDNSVYFYSEYFGFNVMAIRYDSAIDLNQFKNFLGQNSITLVAQTAKETFVPLSESEQELMNELYTFRPTTVLSNDCECEMTLTYKTKKSLEVST